VACDRECRQAGIGVYVAHIDPSRAKPFEIEDVLALIAASDAA
jgi:hypothetical protein